MIGQSQRATTVSWYSGRKTTSLTCVIIATSIRLLSSKRDFYAAHALQASILACYITGHMKKLTSDYSPKIQTSVCSVRRCTPGGAYRASREAPKGHYVPSWAPLGPGSSQPSRDDKQTFGLTTAARRCYAHAKSTNHQ